MSDGTPFLRVAADRIGAPGSPAKMPFRATNAANWSSIIRIGAKMAVIRRQIARRAVSSHTQRAGKVPSGESRLKLALPFKSGSAPVAELGAELLAFIILRMMIAATIGSPGYHCLAIDFDGKVNQDVKARETILTIVLGVLVIAGGRH